MHGPVCNLVLVANGDDCRAWTMAQYVNVSVFGVVAVRAKWDVAYPSICFQCVIPK